MRKDSFQHNFRPSEMVLVSQRELKKGKCDFLGEEGEDFKFLLRACLLF